MNTLLKNTTILIIEDDADTCELLRTLLDEYGADVMIANDTGHLHLAAALGRPVVAPYTCTKVKLTGPYGAETGAVEVPDARIPHSPG